MELTALSTGHHSAREHPVSHHRQRQTISPSYLVTVTSLSFLMVGFLGLISDTIRESCKGYHYVKTGHRVEQLTLRGLSNSFLLIGTRGKKAQRCQVLHCFGPPLPGCVSGTPSVHVHSLPTVRYAGISRWWVVIEKDRGVSHTACC